MSEENAAPAAEPAQNPAEVNPAPAETGTLLNDAQAPAEAEGDKHNAENPEADGKTDGEEKPSEKQEEKEPEGAPENYEPFTIPSGDKADPEVMKVFGEAAKDLNLSQAKAQGLIDKMMPIFEKRGLENIQAVSQQWAERSKNDPEIGGTKLSQSLSDIARLRDKFAVNANGEVDPDIAEFMSSPMGNHPGCLKLLARAGRAFGEAQYPRGNPPPKTITADDVYR